MMRPIWHVAQLCSCWRRLSLLVAGAGLLGTLFSSTLYSQELDLCGEPQLDPALDSGLYGWKVNCGSERPSFVIRALAGGSSTPLNLQGVIELTDPPGALTKVSIEANDVVHSSEDGLQIDFSLNLTSPWIDGFYFDAASGGKVCLRVDLAPGTELKLGPTATPVTVPMDLLAGVPCDIPAADRVNVVVVLTDDQRWNSLWSMPDISELASHGTRFDRAFVSYPVCGPVRASIISGGFRASNTGIISNNLSIAPFRRFNDRDTIALDLQRAGYRTLFVGKYLHGYPEVKGYVPPGWTGWVGNNEGVDEPWYNFTVTKGSSGEQPGKGSLIGPIPQHVTEFHRDEILSFLDEVGSESFFVLWAAFPPHHPATPALGDEGLYSEYVHRGRGYGEEDLSDKPLWVQNPSRNPDSKRPDDEFHRDQLRSLKQLDSSVREIVEKVEAMGEAERTIFFIVSDNGYLWGEHGLSSKGVAYEEAIRVPLVAFGGGVSDRVVNALVLADLDLAPTVRELAGLPGSRSDGESLVPFLRGETPAFRQSVFFESWGNGSDGPFATWAALRTSRWKYIEQANGEHELYDLWSDPFELQSVHLDSQYQSILYDFKNQLNAEKSLAMRPIFRPPAGFVGLPYSLQLEAWGGSGDYRWLIESGKLPTGLQLNVTSGLVEGIPTDVGQTEVEIRVEDGTIGTHSVLPRFHKRQYVFTINPTLSALSADDVLINEAHGTAEFVVTLSPPSTVPVTVSYTTPGEDYESTYDVLTFEPGETVQVGER